jgi:hypothetical protein
MRLAINNTVPLWDYYDRFFNQKTLFLPPHQKLRGSVWPTAKKARWWKTILTNRIVPGCIITYIIKDDPNEIMYINDGANRTIHSLIDFERYCRKNNLIFKDILQSCSITEQSVIYDNQMEAIDHYVSLQMGTLATPFEVLTTRFIVSLENYEKDWEPLFGKSNPVGAEDNNVEDVNIDSFDISTKGPDASKEHKGALHNSVEKHLKLLGCKPRKAREEVHKTYRDNLAMFVRFVSKDESRWSPKVAQAIINPVGVSDPETLENRAAELFGRVGNSEVRKQLKKFDSFLEEKKAVFKQIWLSECHPVESPSDTAVRWWLSLCIWHRNCGYKSDTLIKFTEKWINKYHGKTTMIYISKSGQQTNTNTQLSQLRSLSQVMQACDYTLDEFETKHVSRKEGLNLEEGFVNSHILAHSHNEDGEMVPENAYTNRYRGNRDMTKDELNKCKKMGEHST